ncbi:hypothetical protein CL618_03490 [archaeon]|nr:hypothetical protein [archaeon]|tara:strand:+ start:1709 stop:2083 length:375 start_codon:yes stop_codon:yes gene_type:complete
MIKKPVSIELIEDAKEAYEKLNKIIGEQKLKGKTTSEEIKLWKGIQRSFDLIQENPFYGRNAKKKQIPEIYLIKHEVKNLFIVDLPLFWRMIYTLESDKIEIVSFILDIFNHKDYNKKFGFKGK